MPMARSELCARRSRPASAVAFVASQGGRIEARTSVPADEQDVGRPYLVGKLADRGLEASLGPSVS
jgi:hypothetical protein